MAAHLNNTKILLGICGGIAAYKSAEFCRELKKMGAELRVVMTDSASEFIAPLTLQALSGNPVHTKLLDPEAEAGMGHIELAKWPDIIIVAPATANFIARYSQGLANDLLSTVLIASEAKIAIVPAMNQAMWKNALTQKNIKDLTSALPLQVEVWGPDEGEQACGDVGFGRMLEPKSICQNVLASLNFEDKGLSGKKVLITAGPTREAIDPVRYISNQSSGKMGYALAKACLKQGAEVILVSGPVNLECPDGVERRQVISALDMFDTVSGELNSHTDIFISTAAVADYRPESLSTEKIKKQGEEIQLNLRQNPDIVAYAASLKHRPFTVGFAAETNNVIQYAEAKLKNKKLDMIVANDVSNPEFGFNSDDNEVYVIGQDGKGKLKQVKINKQSKNGIAIKIVELVIEGLSDVDQ